MPTTPNKFLNIPSTGTEVGTWGNSYNTNMGILDNSLGGMTTIAVSSNNVTLSSAQYQNVFLSFTGTLNNTVTVTLPSVGSFYSAQNLTTNSSIYNVILTCGAGQVIAVPPGGEFVDVFADSVSMRFRNLGMIGSYIDMVNSTGVPVWITACSLPPYLYCDGSFFSSAVWPGLAHVLRGTNLPDCRGRIRFSIDQGTANIPSSVSFLQFGGIDNVTITTNALIYSLGPQFTSSATAGVSSNNSLDVRPATPQQNVPPAIRQGITLIRAG